nr:immunoglobulin light chain junction region [Macaca mulatta]
CQHSYVTPYTF